MNDDRLINQLESGLGIQLPSSIDRCFLPGSGNHCMIAREDKLHPIISGNKWRKLKYYLLDYLQSGKYGIATTGGAHSNLLHALAFACHTLKIPTTYFIAGYNSSFGSPMVKDCLSWGIDIQNIQRNQRTDLNRWIGAEYYWIPEGAPGALAEQGLKEQLVGWQGFQDRPEQTICIPTGSGASCAAILSSTYNCQVLTLPTVKAIRPLQNRRLRLLADPEPMHFGSGRQDYIDFIAAFYNLNSLLLDPIYTGRLFWALDRGIDSISGVDELYVIHTGGLQGWRSYLNRYRRKFDFSPELLRSIEAHLYKK